MPNPDPVHGEPLDLPHHVTVRLSRVHDRVSLERVSVSTIEISPVDMLSVEEAITAGHQLSVSVIPDLSSSVTEVADVRRLDGEKACVTVRSLIVSRVIVCDETISETICQFRRTTQLFDSGLVQLPSILSAAHVKVRMLTAICEALSPFPFNNCLTISDTLIQELTVEEEIYAEIAVVDFPVLRDGQVCRDGLT